MLHDPERHEPLLTIPWNESEARATIDAIVRETEHGFNGECGWPWHPKDLEPSDDFTQPPLPMYHGAAGVIWALRYLRRVGAAAMTRSYDEALEILLARTRDSLGASANTDAASFLMGETPVLLMLQQTRAQGAQMDRLAALIERNIDHPARELMWGSPGTMLAATFLHEQTGEERWATLVRTTAAQLWTRLETSRALDCDYWTQALYGSHTTYLGAVHGFVGAAFAILRAGKLLEDEQRQRWQLAITKTISRSAIRTDGKANWPTQLKIDGNTRSKLLMQFCHGAPGFLICLARFPDESLDELLLEAGEAIWAAGPLNKGSNLCHGTGGNGYALLALYERTQDLRWLERARAFAMHGIAQTRADEREYRQYRYSLWTGDLGFAIYLWDCIRARAEFPTLDVF